MSRTDKDLPYWMLSNYWEPFHSGCEYATFDRGRECDLPAEPVRERPVNFTWRTRIYGCCWVPTWDHYTKPWGRNSCPTWYVRLEFTGPERRRVRDECIEAIKEYRGTGEVDTIPSTTQHRHRARWNYW